jgi:predicted RNA-binding Zn-ribbon protein involved in translation (DUF1610 family)
MNDTTTDQAAKPEKKYAVDCDDCGLVYLTEAQYEMQMSHPNNTWRCPKCGQEAWWNDGVYEGFEATADPLDLETRNPNSRIVRRITRCAAGRT